MRDIRQLVEMRKRLEELTSSLTSEELFQVPQGFRNHVAWNAAHAVVTQQLICYTLSGLEPYLSPELIGAYRKGTGADTAGETTYRAVMDFVHRGPELLTEDYQAGRFRNFQRYETSAGIVLENIEDAIAFNNIHESIHLGYALAQRRLVAS